VVVKLNLRNSPRSYLKWISGEGKQERFSSSKALRRQPGFF
jgi:hypothetical protein